jgi:hypothetical protein
MSKLEQFINDNREHMDDAHPSYKVWEKIEVAVDKKKKKSFLLTPFMKWSVAASVLILVGLGGYYIAKQNKTTEQTSTISVDQDPSEVSLIARTISMKQEELKVLSKDQPELYGKFTTDINQLDSSYKALKTQLKGTPNREVLIEAMIQNLQLQLNVLNQQLNIIHQIKDSKNYSHEEVI